MRTHSYKHLYIAIVTLTISLAKEKRAGPVCNLEIITSRVPDKNVDVGFIAFVERLRVKKTTETKHGYNDDDSKTWKTVEI